MRNIREIRTLPVSELSDEEILKAAVDRLKCKAAVFMYQSPDNNNMIMLGRYRAGGYPIITNIKHALEAVFGKFKKMEYEDL